MTWTNALSFARKKQGRLPRPLEIMQIAKMREVSVDVWTCEESPEAPHTAKCWSRKYQAIKTKDKRKMCLLIWVDK